MKYSPHIFHPSDFVSLLVYHIPQLQKEVEEHSGQESESMMNTSRKEVPIYAYPVVLSFEDHQAIFVTLEEPNIFTEPYDSIWIKMAATLVYLVGLWASCILYSFVFYEATGRAASFRTVINQLVSYSYLSVSHFELRKQNEQSYNFLQSGFFSVGYFSIGWWRIRLNKSLVWAFTSYHMLVHFTTQKHFSHCFSHHPGRNSHFQVSFHRCLERNTTDSG